METSPLICSANQGTGFYMIGASFTKELDEIHQKILSVVNSTHLSLLQTHLAPKNPDPNRVNSILPNRGIIAK